MRMIGFSALRLLAATVLVCGVSAAFGQQSDRFTLHLSNSSGYDIYEIHLTSSDDTYWGPDLLKDSVLISTGSIDIINIVAGEHDVMLVDEDGDRCVKMRMQFFQNRTINITDDWLIGCEFHNPRH